MAYEPAMRSTVTLLLGLSLASTGCAFGYKQAADAAMSPLGVRAQMTDQRLKLRLREAILRDQSVSGLGLTPDVVMQRGFVVGFVDSPQQGEAVVAAARSVDGLVSLDDYLPVRPADDSTSSDLELKGNVKAQIALSPTLVSGRYTIEVLDGVVVLLGATMTEAERDEAGQVAAATSGVKEVKNFLLVAEPPYSSLRPHLR